MLFCHAMYTSTSYKHSPLIASPRGMWVLQATIVLCRSFLPCQSIVHSMVQSPNRPTGARGCHSGLQKRYKERLDHFLVEILDVHASAPYHTRSIDRRYHFFFIFIRFSTLVQCLSITATYMIFLPAWIMSAAADA